MRRPSLIAGALVAVGLAWSLLAALSLQLGGVTWDEMFDFEGVNGAFWHGVNWLKGANPDLATITFDLEWFGNATRWPTYLLWRLLMIVPWEQVATLSRTQVVLLSGYFSLNHLNAMAFALAGIGLTAALAWRLGGRRAGVVAGGLLLLLPTWMGHSWMNSKDIPMATSYLLYTLGTTLLLRRERGGAALRVMGIALMAGSRVSSLAFIAVGEALLLAWEGRRRPKRWLGSLAGGLLLGWLLTPQAWGDPFGYPRQAMAFISTRQGAGDGLATLRYLAANLLDLLPSPLLLGLALLAGGGLASALGRGGGPASGHEDPSGPQRRSPLPPPRTIPSVPRNPSGSLPPVPPSLPTVMQLLIPAVLLILGGKSLYNELRHLMMIQPPLCVLAALGYARAPRRLLRVVAPLAAVATLVLVAELLLLHPYQYTYRGDLARLLPGNGSPPLRADYWGYSGRETISRCLKRPACATALAQRPLRVIDNSLNAELVEASANLLRPPPPDGKEALLISTLPGTLQRLDPLAATSRLTLLPRPQSSPLSAIAPAPRQTAEP
ncbi:MAG: hypothetical protein VKO44_02145 [Cyanobacteriota bacterium]|nr:hypothetical protein [Cyanobacteriota bacterium]